MNTPVLSQAAKLLTTPVIGDISVLGLGVAVGIGAIAYGIGKRIFKTIAGDH